MRGYVNLCWSCLGAKHLNIQTLLANSNISRAVIIDDAYQTVPMAKDIGGDADWGSFFDDVVPHEHIIIDAFPDYENIRADVLQKSDAFIFALWNARAALPSSVIDPLFEGYERAQQGDRVFLSNLETTLAAMGITPIQVAGDLPTDARDVPLVFVDLFLGTEQTDADMSAAIERVRDIVAGRELDPPMIVLMSSSGRLADKRDEFRDRAQLLGAMFRVASKADLAKNGAVEKIVTRLLHTRSDAVRLSKFLHAWDAGLNKAKDRFLKTLRAIDLADYSQVSQLLLAHEGQPLGSYLLDIYDRTLQYEIESDEDTIQAAEEMSQINLAGYASAHLVASTDLQNLMLGTIYQNPRRLRVSANQCGAPVAFGDVLLRQDAVISARDTTEEAQGACISGDAADAEDDPCMADVMIVLTPACDLVRNSSQRVMMLDGKLEELTPKTWSYKSTGYSIPIFELPDDGSRKWISWDIKSVRTLTRSKLRTLLGEAKYKIVSRLRDNQALELQQQVLAQLGRVGLTAKIPATFPVSVELAWLDVSGSVVRAQAPALERDGGVYIVGRDGKADSACKLVLSEAARDEIEGLLVALTEAAIYGHARPALRTTMEHLVKLRESFEIGLDAPAPNNVEVKIAVGEESKLIGKVLRNPAEDTLATHKSVAFLIIIRDLDVSAAALRIAEVAATTPFED